MKAVPIFALLLVACSDDPISEPQASNPVGSAGGGGTAPSGSSSTGGSGGGGGNGGNDGKGDAGSDAATVPGPASPGPAGPAPTRTCNAMPDADKIFKLTSPKSDYWVRLPVAYNPAVPTPYPMVVAIHGCGDQARNFLTWGAVPQPLRATQDYIAISIGGREGQCWNLATDETIVDAAIEHVRGCYYAHQKKITLMGYSSGGLLSYQMGLKYASRFAGLLIQHSAISDRSLLSKATWKLNVAHTGGRQDTFFPPTSYNADWAALRAAGFPISTQELNVNHDGSSDQWRTFLLPKIKDANWIAP
jgi:pimeloyl-ACP methyl ester carboxylesterase